MGERRLKERNEAWADRYGGGWLKVVQLVEASRQHWEREREASLEAQKRIADAEAQKAAQMRIAVAERQAREAAEAAASEAKARAEADNKAKVAAERVAEEQKKVAAARRRAVRVSVGRFGAILFWWQ